MNPMHENHQDPIELDLTKQRLASYKQKWKVHQDTVDWVEKQLAQRKGLKFYQTTSNAVILYDTLPAYCISKAIVIKSEEIKTRKCMCRLDRHRRFPTKTIGCVIWILMSLEAAKIPNESNQTPKPNNQVRGDMYVGKSPQRKSRKRTLSDRADVTESTRTARPVCGSASTKRCVLTPTYIEEDQTRTERPVLVDHNEEHEIDFRVPGLSHAVVKEAETSPSSRACKKIENHPHRAALQADLQQNNVYNPFSKIRRR